MATVKAQFDGRVFVPCEPVELPAGTAVEVLVPGSPAQLSPEQLQEWQEIQRELTAAEPAFPTVDDYLRYSRKRP